MHSRFAALLALGAVALAGSPAPGQFRGGRGEQNAGRYGWLSSLEEGKSQAARTGKPLMVVVRCVP
jgi:hypothetical protein